MRRMSAAVVLVVVLAWGVSAAFAGEYVIRFASGLAAEMNHSRAMEQFKADAESKSNGRLKVEVFHSGKLGGTKEVLDQVKAGTIQMSLASTGFMTAYVPRLGVLNFPFLFKSREAALAVFDGPFGGEIDQWVGNVGFKSLGFEEIGWRVTINKVRPIARAEDFAGIKLRLQPIKVHLDTFRLLGANPVAMDWKELYTALQQGVIDGLEGNPAALYDTRFYEVTKYVSDVPFFYEVLGRWINKRFWDGLPPDLQAVLIEASKRAVAWQRKVAIEENEAAMGKLQKAGLAVNRVGGAQLDAFRSKVMPVYKQYEGEFGKELMERILKLGQG